MRAGAFGLVKQATHKATGQVRAVKLISKSNLSKQRNATELLFNEYKMLKESVGERGVIAAGPPAHCEDLRGVRGLAVLLHRD